MSLKSSLGAQLARAESLATGSDGKPIPRADPAYDGMRCKESRAWAPAPTDARDSLEERTAREGRATAAFQSLTADEHEVMRLQGKVKQRVEQRLTIAAGDLSAYLLDGYTLIPGSEHLVARPGLPPIMCVAVEGFEYIETAGIDYPGIAAQMGISERRVERLVESAHRRLRKARR